MCARNGGAGSSPAPWTDACDGRDGRGPGHARPAKSYGSRLALDGLDLAVPTGVVYGFLGPNGAGKTTTMRLLTGLIHPDARHDRAPRPAVRARRPAAPVRGRRAGRVAVVLPVPVGAREPPALAASRRPVAGRPDRRAARARRPARAGERQGRGLLAGHEAAAGDRRRPAQRPEAAPARRAGQRPRPGRHRRDARDAAPPRVDRQDGVRLEPPAGRGPAAGRRRRDHRPRAARPRGPDRDAARAEGVGRGSASRPTRSRPPDGPRGSPAPGTVSAEHGPEAAGSTCRSTPIEPPRSTGRSPRRASTPRGSRPGNDLEALFLELTGASPDLGTAPVPRAAAGPPAGPPAGPRGRGMRLFGPTSASSPPAGDLGHVRARSPGCSS